MARNRYKETKRIAVKRDRPLKATSPSWQERNEGYCRPEGYPNDRAKKVEVNRMKTEVEVARMRNIIGMAWDFTGMKRVFAKGSGPRICRRLEKALYDMERNPIGFSHGILCREVQSSVTTCYGKVPSYGQAAKVLDIAMKVLVGYCRLPNERTAQLIAARLYAAIDNPILIKHLKKNHSVARGIFSISQIDKALYVKLQSLLSEEAEHKGCSPIEYDDWLWRKFNVARAGLPGWEKRPAQWHGKRAS